MHSILRSIENTICETEFEGDFVSMKVTKDKKGNLVVETRTRETLPPFTIGKPAIVRRRFSQPDDILVVVEVYNRGEWIHEKEFICKKLE